jgi:hypothetical protein
MTESQLEQLFRAFLLRKGFSSASFVSHMALRSKVGTIFRPDLLLLDTTNKQYIAVVEFKKGIDGIELLNELSRFYKYFSLLGRETIPAYIVVPNGETDFQIFVLTKENVFKEITKDEFPTFETLSAKTLTDEKISDRELEEKAVTIEESKLVEFEKKIQKSKVSSYWALASLLAGIIVSLITIFFYSGGISTNATTSGCCDTLSLKLQSLEVELKSLGQSINDIDTSNGRQKNTVYIKSVRLKKMEERITTIENGISNNPERTLSILNIKEQIGLLTQENAHLKELNQSKLDSLKSQIDIQNAWVIGILVAIVGVILSFAIPNIQLRSTGNSNAG